VKKLLAILAVLAILSGALPPTLQQAAWTRLLPGRWMLLAGGGADICISKRTVRAPAPV